jgi:hypothetical protein
LLLLRPSPKDELEAFLEDALEEPPWLERPRPPAFGAEP